MVAVVGPKGTVQLKILQLCSMNMDNDDKAEEVLSNLSK